MTTSRGGTCFPCSIRLNRAGEISTATAVARKLTLAPLRAATIARESSDIVFKRIEQSKGVKYSLAANQHQIGQLSRGDRASVNCAIAPSLTSECMVSDTRCTLDDTQTT